MGSHLPECVARFTADISFSFRARFKSFIEQYELRELHFHSLMRTKELEVQHNLARFEREKKKADTEIARSRQLNEQVQTFSKTETELRNQLNVYVDKFKQVCSLDLVLVFKCWLPWLTEYRWRTR